MTDSHKDLSAQEARQGVEIEVVRRVCASARPLAGLIIHFSFFDL